MSKRLFRPDPDAEYFFDEGCFILEVLNDDEDADCSVVQARITPGVTTDWHRLRQTAERYVILDGTGLAEIGELQIAVKPGDVVLIPAMERQRITNTGKSDLVFLAVCTPRFVVSNYIPDPENASQGL